MRAGPGEAERGIVDEATLVTCVRLTARTSALVFSASMFAHAVEARARAARRTPFWRRSRTLLAGLLVSHTVHFAFVGMLAAATHGANIAARHGWIATGMVGALFYAAVIGLIRVRRDARRSPGQLVFEWIATILLAFAFLVAYIGRAMAAPFFVPFVVLLVGGAIADSVAIFRLRARTRDIGVTR
ncbi:MAG: hypothetical protein HYR85_10400 [Planctomycetes bacterium]|nr:hypothetical protein [Planctomycetota bacterium]